VFFFQEHGDTIVKKALANLSDVYEFSGETFSGSMQKKSSTSFPSQVYEGQIENLTPVQGSMAAAIFPAPVNLEAPLTNGGVTTEGTCSKAQNCLPISTYKDLACEIMMKIGLST